MAVLWGAIAVIGSAAPASSEETPEANPGDTAATPSPATDESPTEATADAQANNPLADLVAFNIQNYYIGRLTETGDDANQFWLRYAQPFSILDSSWLVRVSLPLNTFPTPPDGATKTGLGDLNAFAAWLIDVGNPGVSFGVGPQMTFPTSTEAELGSRKWSAGLANILFDGRSKRFQWGYLLTWQHSFAGDVDRATVNVGAFQPFAFYQLGTGWYLRSAPIWVYDFQADDYGVPLGLGLGKVLRRDSTVFNFFVEPQYSVAQSGVQPEWQIYAALNMQFY